MTDWSHQEQEEGTASEIATMATTDNILMDFNNTDNSKAKCIDAKFKYHMEQVLQLQ